MRYVQGSIDMTNADRAGGAVLCHRIYAKDQKWSWVDGMPLDNTLKDAEVCGWTIVYAVDQSMLIEAQAIFDASEAISKIHEANWLQEAERRIDAENRAERAEADAEHLKELLREHGMHLGGCDGLPDGLDGDCYCGWNVKRQNSAINKARGGRE
jgi:hypothetical protein